MKMLSASSIFRWSSWLTAATWFLSFSSFANSSSLKSRTTIKNPASRFSRGRVEFKPGFNSNLVYEFRRPEDAHIHAHVQQAQQQQAFGSIVFIVFQISLVSAAD